MTVEALSPFIGPRILRKRTRSFEPRDYLRHIAIDADSLIAGRAGLPPEVFAAEATVRRAFVPQNRRLPAG